MNVGQIKVMSLGLALSVGLAGCAADTTTQTSNGDAVDEASAGLTVPASQTTMDKTGIVGWELKRQASQAVWEGVDAEGGLVGRWTMVVLDDTTAEVTQTFPATASVRFTKQGQILSNTLSAAQTELVGLANADIQSNAMVPYDCLGGWVGAGIACVTTVLVFEWAGLAVCGLYFGIAGENCWE
jgi:hypothetical protein